MINFDKILCDKWRQFRIATDKGQPWQVDQDFDKLDRFLSSCMVSADKEDRDQLIMLLDIAHLIAFQPDDLGGLKL